MIDIITLFLLLSNFYVTYHLLRLFANSLKESKQDQKNLFVKLTASPEEFVQKAKEFISDIMPVGNEVDILMPPTLADKDKEELEKDTPNLVKKLYNATFRR